jgi:periplasmic copper chaperone A
VRWRPPLLAALVALGGPIGAGCGGDEAAVDTDGFAVLDAWVRPSPPGVDEAAVYVTVENRDAPDDRLIGAESDRCMLMSPHVTEIDDDIARMSEADEDRLGLGVGERVTMEPNGVHLMCLGLSAPLEEGERIEVVLRFAAHAPVVVPVTVEQR